LKSFFRELPNPLIDYPTYEKLKQLDIQHKLTQSNSVFEEVEKLLENLPKSHQNLLNYLVDFLLKVASEPKNMMDEKNLTLVFGPSVFRSPPDSPIDIQEIASFSDTAFLILEARQYKAEKDESGSVSSMPTSNLSSILEDDDLDVLQRNASMLLPTGITEKKKRRINVRNASMAFRELEGLRLEKLDFSGFEDSSTDDVPEKIGEPVFSKEDSDSEDEEAPEYSVKSSDYKPPKND